MKLQDIIIGFGAVLILCVSAFVWMSTIQNDYGLAGTNNDFITHTEVYLSASSPYVNNSKNMYNTLGNTSLSKPTGTIFILYDMVSAAWNSFGTLTKSLGMLVVMAQDIFSILATTFGIDPRILSLVISMFFFIIVFMLIGLFFKWRMED